VPFSSYRDNFDSETLAILEAAFNQAWDAVIKSGAALDQQATRTALADLIVSFASEGEIDPKRLKEKALAALPRTLGLDSKD
jgi:hypothetical protein